MIKVKILIAYHSITGNTEMVAKSMQEGLAGEDVTLKQAKDVDTSTLKFYDLILVGSGIYGGTFHKNIKTLLKNAHELPSKFVLFYTHSSMKPDYYQKFPKKIRKIIDKKGSTILAEFECLGENKELAEEQVLATMQKFHPDLRREAKRQFDLLKGHPNTEDLEKAKNFAKSLI